MKLPKLYSIIQIYETNEIGIYTGQPILDDTYINVFLLKSQCYSSFRIKGYTFYSEIKYLDLHIEYKRAINIFSRNNNTKFMNCIKLNILLENV